MRHLLLMGLRLAAGVVVFVGLLSATSAAFWDPRDLLGLGEKVAVVEISGLLSKSTPILKDLKRFREDQRIRAIVLRVNSPGGVVGPAQEIMREVQRTKKEKKVVASFGSMAASGGYYAACSADLIMANPGTATGSIGVILKLANLEQLSKKLGVDVYSLKAGALKDLGSPFRPLTPKGREVLQGLLDNIHEQFIRDVAKNRKLPLDKVRSLADGRVSPARKPRSSAWWTPWGTLTTPWRWPAAWEASKGKSRRSIPRRRAFLC